MKRTESLMNKDLDGDLSHSESVELERSEWTDPDLRRTRDAWQRATNALAGIESTSPKLPIDAWAHQVHLATRPKWSLGVALRMCADHAWRQRWIISAASLAMVAAMGLFFGEGPLVAEPPVTARLQVKAAKSAPVEIRVGAVNAVDSDEAPVSIRF
ncbi:MAG: hypothetical protein AAFN74_14370 [Myxococcota bacterium]